MLSSVAGDPADEPTSTTATDVGADTAPSEPSAQPVGLAVQFVSASTVTAESAPTAVTALEDDSIEPEIAGPNPYPGSDKPEWTQRFSAALAEAPGCRPSSPTRSRCSRCSPSST